MAHGLEPEYTLVCATRTPAASAPPTITEIGEFDPIGGISYADELNFEGEASFSVEPELVSDEIAPKLLDLKANPMELVIYRNGTWAWQGPLISCQLQGPTLTINSRGLPYYMRYMGFETDVGFGGVDVFTVARGLVDQYQALSYADYGIITTDTNLYGETIDRSYPFENRNYVFDRLSELADIFDFNFWIGSDRVLKLGVRGTDKSVTFHVDEQNVINANSFWSVSADGFSTIVSGAGMKDGIISTGVAAAGPLADRQAFGRATWLENFEGVTNFSTAEDHVIALAEERSDQIFEPGPQVGTVEGGEPTDIEPGDTISYTYKVGKLGTISVKRRIRSMRTSLDEEGQETMELSFV